MVAAPVFAAPERVRETPSIRDTASSSESLRIPLRTDRWCPASPLRLYGKDELAPKDMKGRPANPSWIVDMPVLSVRIEAPQRNCDGSCLGQIGLTLAESVNLWRHLCLRCKPGFLDFVLVDDFVYVDEKVFPALFSGGGAIFERILRAERVMLGLDAVASSDGNAIDSYVRIPRATALATNICKADLSALSSMWPGKLQHALCARDTEVETSAFARLTVAFGDNPCGKNFLACGDPAKRIDFDISDTLYAVGTGASTFNVLGNPRSVPAVDLDAVMLHEMGHFLGLGHLQMKNQPAAFFPAAMLDEYRGDFCISIAETMMLNSMTEAGWRYRATACSGLRRPRSAR
ncbi:hypothetical protein [Bradyrhizobium brasilense]|uniref:hypothetical protein n=1 Tax=Bradyrhizobium brasilense TaxID=1419277 RepID=UPI001E2D63A7|nr:hypothetical protein [Bradyrhizobium brasilense]MCC8974641.1 hypothetical protein [Bradyrhizobium brasilense]